MTDPPENSEDEPSKRPRAAAVESRRFPSLGAGRGNALRSDLWPVIAALLGVVALSAVVTGAALAAGGDAPPQATGPTGETINGSDLGPFTVGQANSGNSQYTIVGYDPQTGKYQNYTTNRTSETQPSASASVPQGVQWSDVAFPGTDYDRDRVPETNRYPWSAVGTVANSGGDDYWCSAAVVEDNHIITAAHCVYDQDTSWRASPSLEANFFAGQQGETSPFDGRAVTYVQTYQRWVADNDRRFDIAVLTLNESIGDETGTLGYESNSGDSPVYSSRVHVTGYPNDGEAYVDRRASQWDLIGSGEGTDVFPTPGRDPFGSSQPGDDPEKGPPGANWPDDHPGNGPPWDDDDEEDDDEESDLKNRAGEAVDSVLPEWGGRQDSSPAGIADCSSGNLCHDIATGSPFNELTAEGMSGAPVWRLNDSGRPSILSIYSGNSARIDALADGIGIRITPQKHSDIGQMIDRGNEQQSEQSETPSEPQPDDQNGTDGDSDGPALSGDGAAFVVESITDGARRNYTFTVDGNITDTGVGERDTEDADRIVDNGDGTVTVRGYVADLRGDGFIIDGEIISFQKAGGQADLRLELDGEDVTADLTGTPAPTSEGPVVGENGSFVVESTTPDAVLNYTFTVDGTITGAGVDEREIEENERLVDNGDGTVTIRGSVRDLYGDGFIINGEIVSFERTGGQSGVRLEFNGVDVTDALIEPEPPDGGGG